MRKFTTLLTVLVFTTLSIVSLAQTRTNSLTGSVADNKQGGLASATVSLFRGKDSSLLKMAVTNKEGKYEFSNIQDGKYLLGISAVGYAQNFSPLVELKEGSHKEMDVIALVPQSKDLKAVTIAARKPLIEQRMDRTIVNVEAAVTNVGASALEVLEKSPGITIDKDGNISLKGKQGVQVYVDGRPSYLSGADLANLLRNMNANQLDQIEIMTNPPAKYDAAGNGGIINIKTKKKISADEARKLMAGFADVKVVDNPAKGEYPTPIDCVGKNETLVGRVREDISQENGLEMWIVSDNLRRGAALNAVLIAERMMSDGLLS